MRVALALAGAVLLATSSALAQTAPRRAREASRFGSSFSVGASVGVGGPRGLAGAFIELRPWRALGIGGGMGLGGAFGPSFDATAVFTPIGTTGWSFGVSGSYSRQITWSRKLDGVQLISGREVPAGSNWLSAAVVNEFRPSRSFMLRLSVGRAWLMNTSDFNVVRPEELPILDTLDPPFPGTTPIDAARAASRGETLGVWFVQVEVAPAWHW